MDVLLCYAGEEAYSSEYRYVMYDAGERGLHPARGNVLHIYPGGALAGVPNWRAGIPRGAQVVVRRRSDGAWGTYDVRDDSFTELPATVHTRWCCGKLWREAADDESSGAFVS